MDDFIQKSYEKLGSAGKQGTDFQIDLSTMVFLNSLRKGEHFRLSTENKSAGKFDDIVVEYMQPKASFFIQTKHKQTKYIGYKDLISDSPKSDFGLPMYFCSYQEIKQKHTIENIIICTNTDVKNIKGIVNKEILSAESPLYVERGNIFSYTFNESFLKDLKETVEKYCSNNLKGKEIDISVDSIRDFFNHLRLIVNYPTGKHLNQTFMNIISEIEFTRGLDCSICTEYVHKKISAWYEQSKGTYLTIEHGKAFFCEMRSNKYSDTLKSYDISFKNTEIFLKGRRERVLHIISEREYVLSVVQVYQALVNEDISKVLFVNKNEGIDIQMQIVDSFKIPCYTYLVIVCSEIMEKDIIQEVYVKVTAVLKNATYKKVILISEDGNELAEGIKNLNFGAGVIEMRKQLSFSDLTEHSRRDFVEMRNVIFQGKCMSLKELLPTLTDNDLDDSVDTDMLVRFVTKETIEVGTKVNPLEDTIKNFYIQRNFNQHNKYISEARMCQYDEPSKENVILISDSPGMGKSTVLTSLATAIKESSPHLWVIRIDVNNYTDILIKLKKNRVKSLTIEELLNSQKSTRMNSSFEQKVFLMPKKVVLMMDGVDEVSPEYKDVVLNLLVDCKEKYNFAKIYVTTRPHLREELEKGLQVNAWTMQPFTKENQIDFLKNYWVFNLDVKDNKKKEKCKVYAKTLITETSWQIWWFFAGVPLQTRMFAEVFQETEHDHELIQWETCDEFLTSDNKKPKLPKKLDVAELYTMFVSKKYDMFVDYYRHSLSNYGKIYEECKHYHRTLALETILSREECEFFDCYKKKGRRNFDEKFPLKLGIIQRIDGELYFMHRTFAEYFVAECLIEQLESENENEQFQNFLVNEVLLCRMQFSYTTCAFLNSVLLKEIDLIPNKICKDIGIKLNSKLDSLVLYESASRGFMGILRLLFKCFYFSKVGVDIDSAEIFGEDTLYAAIKDNLAIENGCDLYTVKCLLENNININSRTQYARTVLHGAALCGHLDVVKYMVENGADIDSRNEYGRTALHESALGGHLDIVKYLVKNGVDVNSTAEYGRTALQQAVSGGRLDIVKYLVENGADIHYITENNHTALYEAASVNIFGYSVENSANVDGTSECDSTAYCEAPSTIHLDIVKYLVANGVDVNSRAEYGRTALHGAASSGYLDMVKYLVENGASINSETEDGHTALYEAAARNHLGVIQYLIENGADTESRTKDGRTALHVAASGGHLSTVKYLIEHNVDINSRCDNGVTALYEAVYLYGWFDVVKHLVENGAEVNSSTVNGRTPLHEAASIGNLDITKYLISSGADVNCKDGNDFAALHEAASRNYLNVVKYLVQNNADVDSKTNDHATALYMAVTQGHLNIVKYLMENGADPNGRNVKGYTALHEAVFHGYLDIVQYLIESSADVDIRIGDGYTVFHVAVVGGHLDMVKYLVDNGIDIHSKVDDRNALHIAAFSGHLDIVKHLVENGVDVESKNKDDRTALHEAARNGYLDVVKYLVENGVDINSKTTDDRTALHEAASSNYLDIVKYLVESGADVDSKTKNDQTPLYEAASSGYLDVVKCLVENGADLDSRDECGHTAFHVAVRGGHLDVVKYFIQNGTDIESKTKNDRTALHEAASISGHLPLVKYLVENGASVDCRAERSRTALHEAASAGNLDTFKYLLENGADVKSKTKYDGCTVFHLAAQGGHLDIVKYLLENGTDVDSKSAYDNTALHEATIRGHLNTVKYLVKSGADVNSKVNYGGTALFLAVSGGHLDIATCLVENGADINSGTDDRTPLQWAASSGHLDVVKYLVENGADLNGSSECGYTAFHFATKGGHLNVVKYLMESSADLGSRDESVHIAVHKAAADD